MGNSDSYQQMWPTFPKGMGQWIDLCYQPTSSCSWYVLPRPVSLQAIALRELRLSQFRITPLGFRLCPLPVEIHSHPHTTGPDVWEGADISFLGEKSQCESSEEQNIQQTVESHETFSQANMFCCELPLALTIFPPSLPQWFLITGRRGYVRDAPFRTENSSPNSYSLHLDWLWLSVLTSSLYKEASWMGIDRCTDLQV